MLCVLSSVCSCCLHLSRLHQLTARCHFHPLQVLSVSVIFLTLNYSVSPSLRHIVMLKCWCYLLKVGRGYQQLPEPRKPAGSCLPLALELCWQLSCQEV